MVQRWLGGIVQSRYAPKSVNMLYQMNKVANIHVKTPVGMTNSFKAEEIVKQGTVT